MFYVYIVKCADDTLYTGIAKNVEQRIDEHNASPKGAKYTRVRRPVILVYSKRCRNRSFASKQEYTIKSLTKSQKLALIDKCKVKTWQK